MAHVEHRNSLQNKNALVEFFPVVLKVHLNLYFSQDVQRYAGWYVRFLGSWRIVTPRATNQTRRFLSGSLSCASYWLCIRSYKVAVGSQNRMFFVNHLNFYNVDLNLFRKIVELINLIDNFKFYLLVFIIHFIWG